MNTIAKHFFSALGLAIAVSLAVPRVAHGEDDPYAPQPQASLQQMLSIDWKKGPSLPQGIQGPATGIVNDILISAGGFCGGEARVPGKPTTYPRGFIKKAWGLDLQSPQTGWQSLPDFPGAAREHIISAVVDNQLYAWGGFSYTSPYTYSDGYRLSRNQGQWSWDALPDLPRRVTSSGISVIGSKIYAVAGADYDRTAFYTNNNRDGTVPRLGSRLLTLDTNNLGAGWQELAQCPGTPRWAAAAAAVGGKLYLFGGATGNDNLSGGYCTVVDNWQYDPATDAWQRLRDLPVASGNFPTGEIVFSDRYILLVGGYQYGKVLNPDGTLGLPYGTPSKAYPNDAYYSDIKVYDTSTGLFGTATGLPVNNNLARTVVQGDQIHLIGDEVGGTYPNFETVEGEPFFKHPDLYLTGTIRTVPEPGTLGLLGTAAAGLLLYGWRKWR